ncbi:glycerophosphodiester phosphodiesterase family protein [Inconstantimicrobium porci]|uniref:GP-PDE domain-containing protein n=1 Tax=Inconstantimicrobium porci TaxID=2652291 RepID=A0A7X2MYI6_9CLOT|nr:glycerophosphodiester phosphodiesterase family protein [Inconstantimicrobium porci]MSR91403.1 hypothetical protein [Inconstantimicrobium porci]
MKTKFKVFIASFLIITVFLAVIPRSENEIRNIETLRAYASNVKDILFIGHRGFVSAAPENTVPSYIMAGREKFWGGETDINTTKDGKWIVLHDNKIDRMTNGTGKVKDLTLKEIRKYHIKCGRNLKLYGKLKIPTFEEYLKTCRDTGIAPVIEFKPDCDITKVNAAVDIIKHYDMVKKCICISFRLPVLKEIRKNDKDIKLQWLIGSELDENHLRNASQLGPHAGIDINQKYLSEAMIRKCHEKNLEVNCWTVNDKKMASKYADWGVDYITSDKISTLKK